MTRMTTSFLARKLDKRFDMLDADQSGFLEEDDFQAIARRFLAVFGESEASARGRAVLDAYGGLWRTLLTIDTDGAGRISREKFRERLMAADFQEGSAFDTTFRRIVATCNVITDTDGDGRISFDEFRRLPGLAELPPDECRSAFDRLDADASGTLSIEEIQNGVREFYTSHDPDAPGNWIFGRF